MACVIGGVVHPIIHPLTTRVELITEMNVTCFLLDTNQFMRGLRHLFSQIYVPGCVLLLGILEWLMACVKCRYMVCVCVFHG